MNVNQPIQSNQIIPSCGVFNEHISPRAPAYASIKPALTHTCVPNPRSDALCAVNVPRLVPICATCEPILAQDKSPNPIC